MLLAAALIALLGGLCVMYAGNADVERRRSAEEARQRQILEVELGKLKTARKMLRGDHSTVAVLSSTDSSEASVGERCRSVNDSNAIARNERDSPAYRDSVRAQQRLLVRREYGSMLKRLALNPEQEEGLINLLVAERVHSMTGAVALDNKLYRDRSSYTAQREERYEKIAAFVGYEKLPIYDEFIRNLQEHRSVTQIGMQFAAVGVPLTEQQKEELVTLMVAERDRVPAPSSVSPLTTLKDLEREFEWMEDQDRRLREGAASVLSAEQLKYLSEFLEARTAGRRASSTPLREFLAKSD